MSSKAKENTAPEMAENAEQSKKAAKKLAKEAAKAAKVSKVFYFSRIYTTLTYAFYIKFRKPNIKQRQHRQQAQLALIIQPMQQPIIQKANMAHQN